MLTVKTWIRILVYVMSLVVGLSGCVISQNKQGFSSALSINRTSIIPIMTNGDQATMDLIPVYVHNNGNNLINNIEYTTEYHNGAKIIISKLDQCRQIIANSRCTLYISPPLIVTPNTEDSILIKARYNNQETNQILNFKYLSNEQHGLFLASLGSTPVINDSYVTIYAYGGGGVDYQINAIDGTNLQSNKHSLPQQLLKNQLLPIEIKITEKQKVSIMGTSPALSGALIYTASTSINASPVANEALLTSGAVPVVQTSTTAVNGSIVILNSGNLASGALMVSYPSGIVAATGSGMCNLNIGLAARASCTLYFTVSNPSNGSGNIVISYGTQNLYTPVTWYNVNQGVLLQTIANPTSVRFVSGSSAVTTVTVSNVGVYQLTGLSVSATTLSGSGTVVISSNTCNSNLNAAGSCTFVATISDLVAESNKYVSFNITGSYNNGNGTQIYGRAFVLIPVL